MTLPVDNIVRVTDVIAEQGLLRREFGITLFLTIDTTLPGGAGRVATFSGFAGIADVFDEDTEPYKAGQIYFSQSPYPRNLVIGRWIDVDIGAAIFGGAVADLADYQAISDGSMKISFAGVETDVTGIDMSGALSYADVATAIEAATNWPAAWTVTFDAINQRFLAESTGIGPADTVTYASAVGTGTDISELIAWTFDDGATLQQGKDAESVEDALEAIRALDSSWYAITVENSFADTSAILDIAAWASPQRYFFWPNSLTEGALTTGEESSVVAQLRQLATDRVAHTWSRGTDYKGLSAAARQSSVNYGGANTVITMKFKGLPGCVPDSITETQKAELDRKLCNAYLTYGTIASEDNIYVEGWTQKPGVFIDVRYFVDWLVDALQVAVFNLLRQTPNKVPQTDAGIASLQAVMEGVLQQAVRNGGIAPGKLSEAVAADVRATTGNTDFDGYLTKGYLIYTVPLVNQDQTDRSQRKAPPTKIWVKGSGAIHFAEIDLVYEN